MLSRAHGVSLGAAVAALFLTTTAARGDDWPQFRRDAGRTAASYDPVKFPLTEVWSWSTRGTDGHTPLYHVAISRGRAYFVARDGARRYLVCADAKSGAVRWKQALTGGRLGHPLSDIVGPAVARNGQVFVYDWQNTGRVPPNLLANPMGRGQARGMARDISEVDGFVIRAFQAETGRPETLLPMNIMGVNGILPRLALMHGVQGEHVHPVPPAVATCPP